MVLDKQNVFGLQVRVDEVQVVQDWGTLAQNILLLVAQ
jgi:hypothetical protein